MTPYFSLDTMQIRRATSLSTGVAEVKGWEEDFNLDFYF